MVPRFVLLDRDGVINTYQPGNYVRAPSDLKFVRGSLTAIRWLTEKKIGIVVISNQAGVGKGLMPADMLKAVTRKLLTEVARAGGKIREVKYCTHRPDAGCSCRKPRPGMIFAAAKRHRFDPREAVFIGDNKTDIEAAGAAGCSSILVLSGALRFARSPLDFQGWTARPDVVERSLYSAVNLLLSGKFRSAVRSPGKWGARGRASEIFHPRRRTAR